MSSVLIVVYWYEIAGVRTPERPTMKFIPTRGATGKPVPRPLTCEAPRPRPANANIERFSGMWYEGSRIADHRVAELSPVLMFEMLRIADSSRLSARNQPIDGEKLMLR